MADKGKTPPKGGKGKGGGGGGGKGGGGGGKTMTGVIKSVDTEFASGQIQPDGDGELHTFNIQALDGKEAVEGQKVEFKSSGKKGKKEATDVVLIGEVAAQGKVGGDDTGQGDKAAATKKEAEPEAEKEDAKPAAKTEEAAASAAADGKPDEQSDAKAESKERTLRDDDECFIADYTANKPEQKGPKFEPFASARRARISRDIVEADPEVELRIRKEPNLEAEELMSIGADDTVEVVGRAGDWVRLAGDDERWMLSVKSDIVLIEIYSAGFFGGGWGLFESGSAVAAEEKAEAGDGGEAKKEGGGGFGGWGLGSFVPTGMLKSTVESVSKNIMAAGSSFEESEEGKKEEKPPVQFPRPPPKEEKEQDAAGKAAEESAEPDLTDVVASTVDKTFDKELELTEGGLAPVRIVSQGINLVEGLAGWIGTTAKEQAKTVQETAASINTDKLVDTAWSGVKGGVQASSQAAASASRIVSTTASSVANTGAVQTAAGYGKTVLSTVGNTVINAAGTVLAVGQEGGRFPNRELGGVLAIEISGVIIDRSPDVDEDEDPFCTDKFDTVAMVPEAIEAISLLVEQRFVDRVHLISVASPGVQAKMMRWLTNRSFYDKTGVSRENVVFCRELDEKEDVCREKGISVMIESSGTGAGIASKANVETVLLFGDGADLSEATQPLEEGGAPAAVKWWKEVLDALLPKSVEPQGAGEEGEEGAAEADKEEPAEQ